jgi:hypothetical protein
MALPDAQTMMDFDLLQKPIEEIQRECRGFLIAAFERGWTAALIANVFIATVLHAVSPHRTPCHL